jgi:hypothetical protein
MKTKGVWQDSGSVFSLQDLIENLEWAIEYENILPDDICSQNKNYKLTLKLEWEETEEELP